MRMRMRILPYHKKLPQNNVDVAKNCFTL